MDIFRLTPAADGNVAWPTLSTSKKSVVTVGAFDGLHVGHHAVIEETVRQARKLDAYSVVIMFDPRPAFVHAYAKAHAGKDVPAGVHHPEAITGVDARLRMLSRMHVDYVLIVRYPSRSPRIVQILPRPACGQTRHAHARAWRGRAHGRESGRRHQEDSHTRRGHRRVRTRSGDRSGRHRARAGTITPTAPNEPGEPGDPLEGLGKAERRAWSKKHNAREVRNQSSTNVRYLLSQGRVQAANEILGHAHAVEGVVEHGEERGRTIGFPTANIAEPMEGYLPVDGVYAGWLVDLGPCRRIRARPAAAERQSRRWGGGRSGERHRKRYPGGLAPLLLIARRQPTGCTIAIQVAGSDLDRHETHLQREHRAQRARARGVCAHRRMARPVWAPCSRRSSNASCAHKSNSVPPTSLWPSSSTTSRRRKKELLGAE